MNNRTPAQQAAYAKWLAAWREGMSNKAQAESNAEFNQAAARLLATDFKTVLAAMREQRAAYKESGQAEKDTEQLLNEGPYGRRY